MKRMSHFPFGNVVRDMLKSKHAVYYERLNDSFKNFYALLEEKTKDKRYDIVYQEFEQFIHEIIQNAVDIAIAKGFHYKSADDMYRVGFATLFSDAVVRRDVINAIRDFIRKLKTLKAMDMYEEHGTFNGELNEFLVNFD